MSGALFAIAIATTATSGGSSGPTYTLSTAGNATSVDEGADLTFYVNTTNVEDGTTLYVYVGSAGTYDISSRFSNGTGTTVAIYSNVGSFTENVSADNTTATGTQIYDVAISTTLSPPNFVSSTISITVNDTSQSSGGGGGGPPPPTLVSIDVTPSTPNIDSSITTSLQMTATGTYSDSSTQDLTSSATWTIDTSSASINSTGLITIPSNDVESGTVSATSSGVTGTTAITIHGAQIPTGSVTGQWNNAGSFGGNPEIWGDAGGYQWAKVYNPFGISPDVNDTVGSILDGSTSYIQTPIHMQGGQHEFTFGFTASMTPGSTFPAGIFDCSHPGGNTGLRAYWSDSTHITITTPGTSSPGVDISQFNIESYATYFWTIRMTLNTIANTGEIDIFVNGVKCNSSTGPAYGGNGFLDAAGVNMILGALYNGDNSAQQNFLSSTWYNFIYYDRALSDVEVTQLYSAQHANLLAPTPPTTYSFVSNFTAGQASSNIYIDLGFGGMGPTVPPDSMAGWYVSGPGISDVAAVASITNIVNDSQFYVTINQSIFMSPGTYTFTNGPAP
jgi:hypothetical protein